MASSPSSGNMPSNAATEIAIVTSVAATKAFSDVAIVETLIQCILGSNEPRITLANIRWVADHHWEKHFRLCDWAQVELLREGGKHDKFHKTGVLDPATGEVQSNPHPALNELFCSNGGSLYEQVDIPLSVLRLRLVSKATDEAMRESFWKMCLFCVPGDAWLHDMLQGITATLGPNDPGFARSDGPAQIRKLRLHWISDGPSSYEEIAKRLPNLEELQLYVCYDTIVEFEETPKRNTPAQSLVNAKGLKDFAIALRKYCPKLVKIEFRGEDYIRVYSHGGNFVDMALEINKPDCIGPILKHILGRAKDDRWRTAADIAKGTRTNNKRPRTTTNKAAAAPMRKKRIR